MSLLRKRVGSEDCRQSDSCRNGGEDPQAKVRGAFSCDTYPFEERRATIPNWKIANEHELMEKETCFFLCLVNRKGTSHEDKWDEAERALVDYSCRGRRDTDAAHG